MANDVQLSSIPKGVDPAATMHFNKDAYSIYCREYAAYWLWVAKNMMHTFRLLNMAEEIAIHRQVIEDLLVRIREGFYRRV